jgi:hypothetical protein
MNKRIKELLEQASDLSFDEAWNEERPPVEYIIHTKDSIYSAPFIEKFAELIVKEMLVTCEQHPAWTGRMIGKKIKLHFGVE